MWFNKSITDIEKELHTNVLTGLSNAEAQKRLEQYGENKLLSSSKKNILQLFFSQINDVMIYILLIASLISAFMKEYSDSIIILIVIFINAIIGVAQEYKAEKSLQALKKLSTPKAIVKRDGIIKEIPSQEVVKGDIVILDAGRYLPADLRLFESVNLKINESAFTGESLPSEKDSSTIELTENIPLGDRYNMCFMSSLVTYGRGSGIAIGTAMDTEIGKIANMLNNEDNVETPLQKRLSALGKILGIGAVIICLIIFIIALFQGRNLFDMLLTSISLAVAAIPEGLPAIVAIVLALGVQRMIKENAIVKNLPSVETLGSVNIICSDKTGTLTLNIMTVKKCFVNDSIEDIDNCNLNDSTTSALFEGMILCSDASVENNNKTGDPTEIALLDAGLKFGISSEKLNKIHERIDEIPFDSDRKLMSTVNKYDTNYRVFTKGAIDNIIKLCNKILINGAIVNFTDEKKNLVIHNSNTMSQAALRVLALAFKDIAQSDLKTVSLEENLIFIGFMGIIDPPRTEVKPSIELCKNAGITPVMITGDHKNTAFAIAKDLNIASSIDECMSGIDIDKYSDTEFASIVNKYRVFARVSPQNKVKIVNAHKINGNIVSMTGDGVNDAPSLKAAHIGVAMGITGTDVAKDAANIILTDDNFATIVNAIEEGRNIYRNIRKSIIFLLSCNLGEIITLFVAILLNMNTPLLPIHILWVNLITDSFPALALGIDKKDKNVMNENPRDPNESLFANNMGLFCILNGLIIGSTTLFAFKLGEKFYNNSLMHAQTLSFVVLSLSQLFFSISMRNRKKMIIKIGFFSNMYLIASILFGLLIQLIIISVPFLSSIFNVYSLSLRDWTICLSISLIPFILNEIFKKFKYNF